MKKEINVKVIIDIPEQEEFINTIKLALSVGFINFDNIKS